MALCWVQKCLGVLFLETFGPPSCQEVVSQSCNENSTGDCGWLVFMDTILFPCCLWNSTFQVLISSTSYIQGYPWGSGLCMGLWTPGEPNFQTQSLIEARLPTHNSDHPLITKSAQVKITFPYFWLGAGWWRNMAGPWGRWVGRWDNGAKAAAQLCVFRMISTNRTAEICLICARRAVFSNWRADWSIFLHFNFAPFSRCREVPWSNLIKPLPQLKKSTWILPAEVLQKGFFGPFYGWILYFTQDFNWQKQTRILKESFWKLKIVDLRVFVFTSWRDFFWWFISKIFYSFRFTQW